MYFLTKIILVLSVIFYSMDQASSIMCYGCYSVVDDGDQDCFDNPKKVAAACPEYVTASLSAAASEVSAAYSAGSTNISNALSLGIPSTVGYVKNRQSRISVKVDECWKILGTGIPSSKDAVHRACGSKEITDDDIKAALLKGATADSITIKMNATSIYRCDTDLCNSSDILSVGSFYSIFALFFVYSINF